MVAPQHWSKYRPFGEAEETYLRDMAGQPIARDANPGIRVEPDFVSAAEEEQIMSELVQLACRGYVRCRRYPWWS